MSGISGLPLSLSTLSFMLSTQGCSRTLEPYAGSYSFISVNTNTGHGLVIDCKSPSTNYRRCAFFISFYPYHHVSTITRCRWVESVHHAHTIAHVMSFNFFLEESQTGGLLSYDHSIHQDQKCLFFPIFFLKTISCRGTSKGKAKCQNHEK